MQPTDDKSRRVSVGEAAKLLGITPEAVRSRLYRGTLKREEDADGRVFVRLSDDQLHQIDDHSVNQSPAYELLIPRLENEIEFLREELRAAREEARRKDHIIAALTERIPVEPAHTSPERSSESPQKTFETPSRGERHQRSRRSLKSALGGNGGSVDS